MSNLDVLRKSVDWLAEYSANIDIQKRNTIFDQLFPSKKTENLADAYQRDFGLRLPKAAYVHAFDTEAHIASRPPLPVPEMIEKMFVKEKIDLAENFRKVIRFYTKDSLSDLVLQDIAMLVESVLAKADVMRANVLSEGEIVINENNVNLRIDYEVPATNKPVLFGRSAWNGADADIVGDLEKWRKQLKPYGAKTRAITSSNVLSAIARNPVVQQWYFNNPQPIAPMTEKQVINFLKENYDIYAITVDELYQVDMPDGSKQTYRFIPENAFIMFGGNVDDPIGNTLWGETPEEELLQVSAKYHKEKTYIAVTQYDTPDPVALWTKASALIVPALKNPHAIIQARVLNI